MIAPLCLTIRTVACTADGEGEAQRGRDIYMAGEPGVLTVVARDEYGNARLKGGDAFTVQMTGLEHDMWYSTYINGDPEDLRDSSGAPRLIGVNTMGAVAVDNR